MRLRVTWCLLEMAALSLIVQASQSMLTATYRADLLRDKLVVYCTTAGPVAVRACAPSVDSAMRGAVADVARPACHRGIFTRSLLSVMARAARGTSSHGLCQRLRCTSILSVHAAQHIPRPLLRVPTVCGVHVRPRNHV